MHGSAGDLQHEEHVDPSERHRPVHVKEVACQHRRRLRAQELPPGRVGVPDRCRRYPQPLENAADCRGSHAVAELEQLALDSLISLALVLSGQTLDQHGHHVLDGPSAASAAISGPARRTPLDPPSPGAVSGWPCATRRLRDVAPGVRCPWMPTGSRATTAGSAAAGRPSRADATTRPTIMPCQPGTPITQVSGAGRLLEHRAGSRHTWPSPLAACGPPTIGAT